MNINLSTYLKIIKLIVCIETLFRGNRNESILRIKDYGIIMELRIKYIGNIFTNVYDVCIYIIPYNIKL